MGITGITKEKLERTSSCTTAKEVMTTLAREGVKLTDEQLEAIAGGKAEDWSLEQLIRSFGDALASFFPEGFNPQTLWGNLPTGSTH